MSEKINKVDEFFADFNCAQTVFALYAEDLKIDKNTALKIAGGFGGGMACAETCGAVTGSYMVIGLKHGHSSSDPDKKAHTKSLIEKFNEKFKSECGSLICRELTGFDISVAEQEEAARNAGVFTKKCPGYIKTACKIMEENF